MMKVLVCGDTNTQVAQSILAYAQEQFPASYTNLDAVSPSLEDASDLLEAHLLVVLAAGELAPNSRKAVQMFRQAGRRVLPAQVAATGVVPQAAILEQPVLDFSGGFDTTSALASCLTGALAISQGDPATALRAYNAARRGYVSVGDKPGEMLALQGIGECYILTGQLDQALVYFTQALPLVQQYAGQPAEARVISQMARVYAGLGQRDDAISHYETAVRLYEALSDPFGLAVAQATIGQLREELDDTDAALAAYRAALSILAEIENPPFQATVLTNMGAIYSRTGRFKRALQTYDRSLDLLRTIGNVQGQAVTLNNMGRTYDQLGQHEKALQTYGAALPLYEQTGNKGGLAITHYNIAHLHYRLADLDAALHHIEQCVALGEALNHPGLDEDRRFMEQVRELKAERDRLA